MAEWWGHEAAAGFRFFEPSEVAGVMEVAGFFAGVRLERTSYPEEIEARRASPAGATPDFEPGRVRTGHGRTTERSFSGSSYPPDDLMGTAFSGG